MSGVLVELFQADASANSARAVSADSKAWSGTSIQARQTLIAAKTFATRRLSALLQWVAD
jgi:hypothetical protein